VLKKLIFDKETSKVYCENTDGERYAEFPISFNFWAGVNSEGQERTAIPNGEYPISNENADALDYGYDMEPAYGRFWVALDRVRGRGFHGYGAGRSIDSGTYGCIRGENEDGEEICRAIEKSIDNGIEVVAEVIGDVDETQFIVGYDGNQ